MKDFLRSIFYKLIYIVPVLFLYSFLYSPSVFAANRTVDLVVAYKTVDFAGKSMQAIAVNNQIPGPTLRFNEGDHITINVYNQLDKGTTIHWHGLLLPWKMDGVEYVTQEPIAPGEVFRYEFTLNQSGTYWYHAHAGLQEQQGLYGAFVIDPPSSRFAYTKDYTIVLSDWINNAPERVLANLKKEGDYYSTKFPLQASLQRFLSDYEAAATQQAKDQLKSTYKMMQDMRMSIYDISDVAYDTFLLNGQPPTKPWKAPVKVGDTVRLRFIGAGASTFFRVKIPNTKMQMVHVQGNDIVPYEVDDFTIAPGETYDVLVKIQKNTPYIIYAESADTLGAALGALVTDMSQPVDFKSVPPFPEPQPQMSHAGMDMPGMKMPMASSNTPRNANAQAMSGMDMPGMKMPMNSSTPSNASTQTMPGMDMSSMQMPSKYAKLRAVEKTNDPNKPVEIIEMRLNGYMGRYIWFLNGLPEYKAKPILIQAGKRYRFIFINETMMHHPMHLHGHWMYLRNGNGAYDPRVHTIDVAPNETVTADFDATEGEGHWYFHCHNLYHMMAGMARPFYYEGNYSTALPTSTPISQNFPGARAGGPQTDRRFVLDRSAIPADEPSALPAHSTTAHPMGHYFMAALDLGGVVNTPNSFRTTFESLIGSDYNKLQLFMNDAEFNNGKVENADLDIFYWRMINEFWAVKGGVNYVYRPTDTPYWQPGIGIEGVAPYFIDTDVRAYWHSGAGKLDIELGRDTQLMRLFFLRTSVRGMVATKTVEHDQIGSGLNFMEYKVRPFWQVLPNLAFFVEWNYTDYYGAARNILLSNDEATSENAWSIGFSVLF